MTQLLQLNQSLSYPATVSGSIFEEGSARGEKVAVMVAGLAEKSIALALECALSHHCTRTLLLVFHAVMVFLVMLCNVIFDTVSY
jgi:hypothetical protein